MALTQFNVKDLTRILMQIGTIHLFSHAFNEQATSLPDFGLAMVG